MHGQPPMEPELSASDRELEAALGALQPTESCLDTSAALFEAGRFAGISESEGLHRRVSRWRWATAMLATAAAVSVVFNVQQMIGTERVVYVQAPASKPTAIDLPVQTSAEKVEPTPQAESAEPSGGNLLALRTLVLRDGVEALPPQQFSLAGRSLRAGDLIP